MRTKTLLIAAAALAAAITSSQAQTVYSQNIVGYVNTTLAGNGAFSMITSPVNNGTNTVESQMGSSLSSGDTVYVWTGTGYYSSTFIGGNAGPAGQNWLDEFSNWTNSPTLASGQGFFYSTQSGNQETNTWTGSVVLTNQVALPGNGAFSMIGSCAPIVDAMDGTNLNLPLNSGDTVYVWQGTGYYSSTFIGGNAGPAGQNWLDQFSNWTNAPTVSVGQGFFYSTQSGSAETWNQNVSYILNP